MMQYAIIYPEHRPGQPLYGIPNVINLISGGKSDNVF